MCKWNAVCRRFVAVVVLLAGLILVPSVPAFAAGDSGDGEATQKEGSILAQAIDWLVDLLGSEDGAAQAQEGDNGPTVDPSGRK